MYTLSDYDRGFLDEITPTFTAAQVFGLGVEYGLENMTPVALKTVYDSWTDSSPILSREKYNEVYKDLGIKYEKGMTEWEADMAQKAQEEQLQYNIMTNFSDEIRYSYLSGIGLPMLFDPINFVGAGAAVFGMRMVRTGMLANSLKTLGNPIVDGALTGFAGEMATIESKKLRQEDWSMAEVAAGTFFGGAWGMLPWGYGRAALGRKTPNSPETEVDVAKAANGAANDEIVPNEKGEPENSLDHKDSNRLTTEGKRKSNERLVEIDAEMKVHAEDPKMKVKLEQEKLTPEARKQHKEAYESALNCRSKGGA